MRTISDLDGGTIQVPDNPPIPAVDHLAEQLRHALNNLNSARFWHNREPSRASKLDVMGCQAEVDRLTAIRERRRKRGKPK